MTQGTCPRGSLQKEVYMSDILEIRKDNYMITDDPKKVDIDALTALLSTSYWASRRPKAVIEKSISNSLCFSLYKENIQIGFARIVTDYATFAYLCDVIIEENYRGTGIGRWLINTVITHPDISPLRSILIITKDAHELYRKLGFKELKKPEQYMERLNKKGRSK